METLEGRAKLVKLATPLLNNLKPGPFRQMMTGKLADLTTRRAPAHAAKAHPRGMRRASPPGSLRPSAHVRMLALLVRHPSLADLISEEDDSLAAADPSTGAVYRSIIETILACRGLTGTELRTHLQALTGNAAIAGLLSMDLLVPEAGLEAEFSATLQLIAQQARERRLDELIRLSRSGELDDSGREEMRRLIGKPRTGN
jgi:DNA primase